MHPRYLVGPTIVVVGMLLVGMIGLIMLKPPPKGQEERQLEDLLMDEDIDEEAVANSLIKRYKQTLMFQSIGGVAAMILVCFLPIKSHLMAWLLRPVIFGVGWMVAGILQDAANQNTETLFTKILVLAGLGIIGMTLSRLVIKSIDSDSKLPASSAWIDYSKRYSTPEDDPSSLARLKHFQNVAGGAPRRMS